MNYPQAFHLLLEWPCSADSVWDSQKSNSHHQLGHILGEYVSAL